MGTGPAYPRPRTAKIERWPSRAHPGCPAALRPAVPGASTPLPGSFTLTEDASTREFDGGTVLLGGSPLRLFRISERARQLVERWRSGAAVGNRRPAQLLARRLVSGGAFVPQAADGALGYDDVTVVVPVRDRPAQLDRVLDALEGLACIVVDDASADAGATKEVTERHGARFVGLATNVGPAGARERRAGRGPHCAGRIRGLRLRAGRRVARAVVGPLRRSVGGGGGTAHRASRSPACYETARSSLDRGDRGGPVRPGSRIPFVPSAALLLRADVTLGPDLFDAALRGGEDVDLVWRLGEAGWDVRYVPSSTVAHEGPTTLRAFLARRAFYGTTAAPLARRHGEALAPVHLSGWSLAVWSLVLARRPVLALATLAASVAILARRLRGLVRDPVGVAAHIAGGGTHACGAASTRRR